MVERKEVIGLPDDKARGRLQSVCFGVELRNYDTRRRWINIVLPYCRLP